MSTFEDVYQLRESNSVLRIMTPLGYRSLAGEAGDQGFEPWRGGFGIRPTQPTLSPEILRPLGLTGPYVLFESASSLLRWYFPPGRGSDQRREVG